MEIGPGVASGVAVLQDAKVGRGSFNGEVLPVLGELTERVEEAPFGGGQVLEGDRIPAAAQERDDDGTAELGPNDAAVARQISKEIGGESGGQPGSTGQQPGGSKASGGPDEGGIIASDHGRLAGDWVIAKHRLGGGALSEAAGIP